MPDDAVPPDATDLRALDAQARAVLAQNDRGGYTVPNGRVYPFQWNWDSAFVALGFSVFDCGRGWQELETLFSGQWPDGMVPSIVFHAPADNYYPGPAAWDIPPRAIPTTGISQPPVAAIAARALFAADPDRLRAEDAAKRLLPKLIASHRWWHEIRDPDGTGLVAIVHPWETGRDNSPEWDAPLAAVTPRVDVSALRKDKSHVAAGQRPTDDFYNRVMTLVEEAKALRWDGEAVARRLSLRVCDIGVQSILLRADADLIALARALGVPAEARPVEGWLARSRAAMALMMGADGFYHSRDLVTGVLADTVGSGSFLPLIADVPDAAAIDRLAALLTRTRGELRCAAVPSCLPTSRGFDSARYWRGPVWLIINRLIADGFARCGRPNEAAAVRADSMALVTRSGLVEYYDPLSGQGLGGTDFSWTAAMWLHWLGRPDAPDRIT